MNASTEFRIAAAPVVLGLQVLPEYQLLYSGYDHMGVLMDLYGSQDEDGVEVCDVTLVGDKRSLGELIKASSLADMTHFVERRMEAQADHAARHRFVQRQTRNSLAHL